MWAAREAGINFLDDARYNDETGQAPLPTGYSEVVFGELFRAAGWRRDEVVVSNKLWWEFWPDQSPAQELAGSLARMGLDHIDLIYSEVPPDGVGHQDAIEMITRLIRAGTARAWGDAELDPGSDGAGLADRRPRGRSRSGGGRSRRTAWCAGRSSTIRRCAAWPRTAAWPSSRPTRWRAAS